ncbi:hypothetical protein D3875_21140 [Deinococcus cavernae]|uniref:Uncharacterized protein n=1 Tax=Deinococcus cavernae TaxID=2320857 RepID=A0A418UZK0_9DEIO|nr:hypothetical protein [Deinococcus cavernae]RJF68868.1 hypothetical protein D3875_21140 [Deinococcus cavernae]
MEQEKMRRIAQRIFSRLSNASPGPAELALMERDYAGMIRAALTERSAGNLLNELYAIGMLTDEADAQRVTGVAVDALNHALDTGAVWRVVSAQP